MTPNQIVTDGIRKFVRMTALRSDPILIKWVRDEFDLTEALEVVGNLFHQTRSMLGEKMYKGQPFDCVEDVKRDTEEFLLTGREHTDIPVARRKNLSMYHLIVEPVIDLFKGMEHDKVLETVDATIQGVINELYTMDVNSHYDDALVAREQVRKMIYLRENRRKLELAKKRKGRKARYKAHRNQTNTDLILKKEADGQELRF